MAAPIPLAGGAADGGGEDSAAAAGASLATRSRATINGRHDGQDVGRWQPPRGGSRRGSELAEGRQSQEAPEIDKRSSHGAQGSTEDGGRSEGARQQPWEGQVRSNFKPARSVEMSIFQLLINGSESSESKGVRHSVLCVM